MHQDDIATILISVDVGFFVDDGIELALGAYGHQTQFAITGTLERWERMDVQVGFTVLRGKLGLMKGSASDLELFF